MNSWNPSVEQNFAVNYLIGNNGINLNHLTFAEKQAIADKQPDIKSFRQNEWIKRWYVQWCCCR